MTSIFQILTLAWSLQGGYLPTLNAASLLDRYFVVESPYFIEYSAELSAPIFSGHKGDAEGVYLRGSVQDVFLKSRGFWGFSPIQDTYVVGAGLRWGGLTVGWDHLCTHSVETDIGGRVASQYIFGGYDKVFVQVAGSL